jgi:hypothetical protein
MPAGAFVGAGAVLEIVGRNGEVEAPASAPVASAGKHRPATTAAAASGSQVLHSGSGMNDCFILYFDAEIVVPDFLSSGNHEFANRFVKLARFYANTQR